VGSVDRLGRSLQDLIGFLSELHALGISRLVGAGEPRGTLRAALIHSHFTAPNLAHGKGSIR